MRRIGIFICLVALLVTNLVLSACNRGATETPVITNTMTDEGTIEIDHASYYYQRVFTSIAEPYSYRSVTFAPKNYGAVTPTGVSIWLTVTFTDGKIEDLLFAGTLLPQTEYRLTKHEHPRAGIMEAYNDHNWVLYILVSTE